MVQLNRPLIWLKNILAVIGFACVCWFSFSVLMNFSQSSGTISDGKYRGIEVGVTKARVLTIIRDPNNSLKLSSYVVGGNHYFSPALDSEHSPRIGDSDTWILASSSWQQETIYVEFRENRVVEIKFARRFLDL